MSPRRCWRPKRLKFKSHLINCPRVPPPRPWEKRPPIPRKFVFWFHGLGDSRRGSVLLRDYFRKLKNTGWSFPSAPSSPVTCNDGKPLKSWFDVLEMPVTSHSPNDEEGVLNAVESVHKMLDKVIDDDEVDPKNVFVCGFSQGGALALASVLLYPRVIGGGALLSGWLPFSYSKLEEILPNAQKTPIFWSHGMVDDAVLFEAAQGCPLIFRNAGINCEFMAYPELGHTIVADVLRDLQNWMISRLETCSSPTQSLVPMEEEDRATEDKA